MSRKRKRAKKTNQEDLEDWDNYMDIKKSKLMKQFRHDLDLCKEKLSDIFKGIAIFVNGLTRPSAEELKVLMMKHGGVFHTYQVSSTTHIIASNLPNVKIKHLGRVPIVKPQWITESIDVEKLLDFRRYLLYTNQSKTQPRLQFPVIPKPSTSNNIKDETEVLNKNESNNLVIDKVSTEKSFVMPIASTSANTKNGNVMMTYNSKNNKQSLKYSHNIYENPIPGTSKYSPDGYKISNRNGNDMLNDNPNNNKHLLIYSNTIYENPIPGTSKYTPEEYKTSMENLDNTKKNDHDLFNISDNILFETDKDLCDASNDRLDTHDITVFDIPNLKFGNFEEVAKVYDIIEEEKMSEESNISDDGDIFGMPNKIVESPEKITKLHNKISEEEESKKCDTSHSKITSPEREISPISPDIFADDTPPDDNKSNEQKSEKTNTSNNETGNNHISEISKNTANNIRVDDRKNTYSKTAADPSFLKEFYNNSRLHLISTLCAEFKQLVTDLREKSDGKFPGRQKLIETNSLRTNMTYTPGSIIMHIDMDCFFVSVGLRTRPHLRNKPVAVTHGQGNIARPNVGREAELELRREHSNPEAAEMFNALDVNSSMSEIASCSYEARKHGLKNGMFLGTALRLCPDLQTIPYDFQGYREVSTTLYKTVASYTLDIEAVSCDEMYVDVTRILQETGLSVEEWATRIRKEIMEKTGCPCSAGFGANRLQARLATKKAKPAGQFYLQPDSIETYMQDIPLADIPGVGYATLAKLKNLGLTTCGDIQLSSPSMLKAELGQKNGETLYQQARGIDNKPLNFSHQRKTVSTEVNYGIRFKTLEETYNFLRSLSHEVYDRLKATNLKAKCVTLKLMIRSAEAPVQTAKYLGHGICDSITKSTTVNSFLTSGDSVFREIKSMYDRINPTFEDLRGIGIHLTRLEKDKGPKKTLLNFCKKVTSTSSKGVTKPEDTTSDLDDYIPLGQNKFQKEMSRKETQSVSKIGALQKKLIYDENKPSTSRQVEDMPLAIPSTSFATNTVNPIDKSTKSNTACKRITLMNVPVSTCKVGPENEAGPSTSFAASIDLEVFRALPEEIQREIAKEYKIDEFLQESADSEMIKQIEIEENRNRRWEEKYREFENIEETLPTSPFHSIDKEELKSVIRNWINTEKEPNEIDTHMLGTYCKELAKLRKIEYLKMLTSFLYRVLSKKDCAWHKAYFEIVNTAQQGMVARYGSTLLVNRTYECCKMW